MRYYVNRNEQANGDHEVHKAYGCPTPAEPENQVDLGDHPNCHSAVAAAKRIFPQSDGCANCSPECHTT